MYRILRTKWPVLWFYGAVAICLFIVAATWLVAATRFGSPTLQFLNLRTENNGAAWWSGILLLLAAVHAFDGWALFRRSQPRTAFAWLSISMILVMLSLDEIGSLHERANRLLQLGSWWSLLPFAIILLSMLGFALGSLWMTKEHRAKTWPIGFAFFLFAVVALLEFVGDIGEWPSHMQTIRGTVEEATELLAMIILLKVSMANTQGLFDPSNRVVSPTLEAVAVLRIRVLVIGSLVAPVLAYVTASLTDQVRGRPADWFAAVIFVFAGLAAIRSFLMTGREIGLLSWSLLLLCCVASIGTMLNPLTSVDLPMVTVNQRLLMLIALSLLIWAAWALEPKYRIGVYVPAVGVVGLVLSLFWIFQKNLFFSYWLTQCIALGVYYVNSAPDPSRVQQPKRLSQE